MDHHQLFNNAVTSILPWLGNAETTLAKLLKEPISADPTAIEKQIEKLQVCSHMIDNPVQYYTENQFHGIDILFLHVATNVS